MKDTEQNSELKIDLHIHSKYSFDCLLSIEKIIKIAKKKGLDGFAIIDHNTVKGGLSAKSIKTDLVIIPGAEIETELGEITGYFLSEEIKASNFDDVINRRKYIFRFKN